MMFEFDEAKSRSNKAKHAIDFLETQALWNGRLVLLPAKDIAEKRYLVLGTSNRSHWSAIITYRGAAIRIISVRKATAREVETYEKAAP